MLLAAASWISGPKPGRTDNTSTGEHTVPTCQALGAQAPMCSFIPYIDPMEYNRTILQMGKPRNRDEQTSQGQEARSGKA